MIVYLAWAVENSLVYLRGYSGKSLIVIVHLAWAVENSLVNLRAILVSP